MIEDIYFKAFKDWFCLVQYAGRMSIKIVDNVELLEMLEKIDIEKLKKDLKKRIERDKIFKKYLKNI